MNNSLKKVLKVLLIVIGIPFILLMISYTIQLINLHQKFENDILQHNFTEKFNIMLTDYPTTTGLLDDAGIHSMDYEEKYITLIYFDYKEYDIVLNRGPRVEVKINDDNDSSGKDGRLSTYDIYADYYEVVNDDFNFSDEVVQKHIDMLNLKIDEFYNEYIMEKYDCTYLVDC